MKFCQVWALTLLLKLFLAWQLQLFGDEAFYAWEAAKPAMAYSDLPGMTAWLIRFGIEAGGYSPFAARLVYVLIGAAIPLLIVRIARQFSDDVQAWQAGIFCCCLPLMLPIGFLALPDAPLCLAALLCLDAALRLLQKSSALDCLQLGVGLLVGANTHYRFLIIVFAGAAGFILAGGFRRCRDPGFLLALVVGICAWLPLFFYNQQHDFAGWQFQFHERNPWQFSSRGVWHLPIQAIITTPILYAALLWCLWRVFLKWREGEKRMGLVFASAGIPVILFAVMALFVDQVRTSFHWPLQALLVLIAMLPIFLSKKFPQWYGKINGVIFFSGLLGVSIAFAYFFVAAMPNMSGVLAGKKAYPDNFVGWNEVSDATKALLGKEEILVADNFMLAAQLRFSFAGAREVYVLDHPLNQKHGRARQLQDWNLDRNALMGLRKNTPVVLVIEESATKPWLRDEWRAKLCNHFNGLRFEKMVYGPGKGKSFSIFRARLGAEPRRTCDMKVPES